MTSITSEHALAALKEILMRALGAAEHQWTQRETLLDEIGDKHQLQGWDLQFAAMTREKQAEWLLQLFSVLMSEILAQKLMEE